MMNFLLPNYEEDKALEKEMQELDEDVEALETLKK